MIKKLTWNLNISGSKERIFIPKGEEIELVVSDNKECRVINYKGKTFEFDYNILPLIHFE
ncbi:hypothetical protein [uncultured Clostridium sp.]|uniref:hypothetical protein n=1 Tax=uncultured Clostridium sp. TaxID=59620 RepID=UPI0025D7435E|nr:hypothetical protein [uncultured Clostridium sp.]